jgi:hypothetical protein
MTEVSPVSTLSPGPKTAPPIPFSTQQQPQERDGSKPQPYITKEKADMVEGGTEVKPTKALVPLLGVPEGRVEGHEAHYVTKTTKARWDGKRLVEHLGFQLTLLIFLLINAGAMSEIANALKDIDVKS